MLKINDVAPLFSLLDQNGNMVHLADYRGKKVVVYFYPKDFTGGCTLQAKSFAALYDEFATLGYTVIGISKDDVLSHKSFCTSLNLPFLLLSDPTRETIKNYGVSQEVVMHGDPAIDSRRMTFVVDEDGRISHVFPDVDPKDSSEALLQILRK